MTPPAPEPTSSTRHPRPPPLGQQPQDRLIAQRGVEVAGAQPEAGRHGIGHGRLAIVEPPAAPVRFRDAPGPEPQCRGQRPQRLRPSWPPRCSTIPLDPRRRRHRAATACGPSGSRWSSTPRFSRPGSGPPSSASPRSRAAARTHEALSAPRLHHPRRCTPSPGVVPGLVLLARSPRSSSTSSTSRRASAHDATTMFRILGGALALALLAAGDRPTSRKASSASACWPLSATAGALAFLISRLRARSTSHGLPGLAVADLHRPGRDAVARSAVLARAIASPRLMHGPELRTALRLLRSPSGHRPLRARQLAERQARCRPRRLARHPRASSASARSSPTAGGCCAGAALSPVHSTFAHARRQRDEHEGLNAALHRAPPPVGARRPAAPA